MTRSRTILFLLTLLGAVACERKLSDVSLPPPTTLPSGLIVQELAAGRGEPPLDGSYVAIHYEARVRTERAGDAPFDSTRGGEPFIVKLGTTPLIAGLTEGLRGMKEGGRRRLTIPPALGYGAIGKGAIPPGTTLDYDVELVAVFARSASGLQYRVMTAGAGEPPHDGQRVEIQHRAWLLETGRELSNWKDLQNPVEFVLGKAAALPGLEEALHSMRPGARWLLALPPKLAYGEHGVALILLPTNDVMMDVELLKVR